VEDSGTDHVPINPWSSWQTGTVYPRYPKLRLITTEIQTIPPDPDPMNHSKILKGWFPRDAPSKKVPQWYKIFLFWSGKWKSQSHDLVRRIRFWRTKSPEQDFKYVYWTISKVLVWNIFTMKGQADAVERYVIIETNGCASETWHLHKARDGAQRTRCTTRRTPQQRRWRECVALFYWPEGEEN